LYPNILNETLGERRYGIDPEKEKGVFLNMGFAVWRNTPAARAVISEFLSNDIHKRFRMQYFDDQVRATAALARLTHVAWRAQFLFNNYLRERAAANRTKRDNWSLALDISPIDSLAQCSNWANFKVYILPPVLFAHQQNFFKLGVGAKVNVAPYAIHFNVRENFRLLCRDLKNRLKLTTARSGLLAIKPRST